MMQSGISKLLQDGKTPTTMLGALEALKYCADFCREDGTDAEIPTKHYKFGGKMKQEPKQEYFEYDVKSEPIDLEEMPERDVFVPSDFLEQAARIATELQSEEERGHDLLIPSGLETIQ